MKQTLVTVDTARYERAHGKPPNGKDLWSFRLCTDRVTEKDYHFTAEAQLPYDEALKAAVDLAERRRAHTVVVLP
jgi:hypothetical protein